MVDLVGIFALPLLVGVVFIGSVSDVPQPLEQHMAVLLTAVSSRLFAERELKGSLCVFWKQKCGSNSFFLSCSVPKQLCKP